ncbi:hypothetical protein GCM10010341_54470 [Streptomyces noursei]|nr:hypothetical protein GCM10010341_54470 [Streptomyces noursei]
MQGDDVGVAAPGEGPRLGLQHVERGGPVRREQSLEDDIARQPLVAGQPHLAHAPVQRTPREPVAPTRRRSQAHRDAPSPTLRKSAACDHRT